MAGGQTQFGISVRQLVVMVVEGRTGEAQTVLLRGIGRERRRERKREREIILLVWARSLCSEGKWTGDRECNIVN